MPRLEALSEYWNGSPPVNETVASYLGIKSKGSASAPVTDLLGVFGQGEVHHFE